MKNTLIKLLAVPLCLASGAVFAADTGVCVGGAVATDVSVTAASFIKQNFTAKCSANVWLNYDMNDTDLGVCAASKKGNFKFSGSTAGGAVSATGTKATAGYSAAQSASTSGCS